MAVCFEDFTENSQLLASWRGCLWSLVVLLQIWWTPAVDAHPALRWLPHCHTWLSRETNNLLGHPHNYSMVCKDYSNNESGCEADQCCTQRLLTGVGPPHMYLISPPQYDSSWIKTSHLFFTALPTCSSSWVLTTLWALSHWSATCSPPWPAGVLDRSCGCRWLHWTVPPRHFRTGIQHLWGSPPTLWCLRAERKKPQKGNMTFNWNQIYGNINAHQSHPVLSFLTVYYPHIICFRMNLPTRRSSFVHLVWPTTDLM